jgi:predicted RNase H-like HicB family nuclease
MQYLAFIEQDATAWGGFIQELHVTVTGTSRTEVIRRLSEAGALTVQLYLDEGRAVPPPLYASIDDLPEDDREDAAGMEAIMIELV